MDKLLLCIVIFLAACTGSPATDRPSKSNPIFFEAPKNNEVFLSHERVNVDIQVAVNAEIEQLTLNVDGRDVRLLKSADNSFTADSLDEGLLILEPGEHRLTAKAVMASGETVTESVTIHSVSSANVQDPSIEPKLVGIKVVNAATGEVYAELSDNNFSELLIPLADIQKNAVEFQLEVQGNIHSLEYEYFDQNNTTLESGELYAALDDFVISIGGGAGLFSVGRQGIELRLESPEGRQYVWIEFFIVGPNLIALDRAVQFTQQAGDGALPNEEIEIINQGGIAGEFIIEGVPSWLSLDQASGSLEPEQSAFISMTADACNDVFSRQATLRFNSDGGASDIIVTQECVAEPVFDFALDRFYFNQSIPVNDSSRPEGSVELVAGRQGLARAFVTVAGGPSQLVPEVELHYRTANGAEGVYQLSRPDLLLGNIAEGDLSLSFNEVLPESFFEASTEYYVVVDPNNEFDERIESNNRFPAEGYRPLKIRKTPPLVVTFIPLVRNGDSLAPQVTEESIEVLLQSTMALMPLASYNVTIREQPYVYSGDSWTEVLNEVEALRIAEGGKGHYFGVLKDKVDNSDYRGWARIGGKTAVGLPDPMTVAHELGHNLGLRHVQCKKEAGVDINYPFEEGQVGLWGYNIFSGILKTPAHRDFMSYCTPEWISEYHYRKILSRRGGDVFPRPSTQQKLQLELEPQEVLVIEGVVQSEKFKISRSYRAFRMLERDAANSEYTISFWGADNESLLSQSLSIFEVSHSEAEHFSAMVPFDQLNNFSRVTINKAGEVYLDMPWQKVEVDELKVLADSVAVKIGSDQQLSITWPQIAGVELQVIDPVSKNILAMNRSGNVKVFGYFEFIELQINKQGQEYSWQVAVD